MKENEIKSGNYQEFLVIAPVKLNIAEEKSVLSVDGKSLEIKLYPSFSTLEEAQQYAKGSQILELTKKDND